MSKPEWGTKRTCQSCGAHFYDLRKDTIVCPKCGVTYDPEAVLKSRRGRVVEKLTPVKPVEPVVPEPEEETEAEDIGAAEEEEVIEDTSELGEDDEDVSEVIEGVDDEKDR
ncbi:MAG TPA: TIGR02300 family protein [Dongiaceae bacterium]|nr:TIGR02300 family protein [Dongiaceae bacterium]